MRDKSKISENDNESSKAKQENDVHHKKHHVNNAEEVISKPRLDAGIDQEKRFGLIEQTGITSGAIDKAGIFVFAVSGVGIVFLVILSLPFDSIANYRVIRSAEVLLTLAGISLIVTMAGKNTNLAMKIFAFLLIGALIVPSSDLIRFALIASGSDTKYRDLFVEPNVGKSQIDRTRDVANQAISQLVSR